MILPGTYQNGFAPRDGEPLFPELWRGCVGAWNPGLGPSGLRLYDWSPFKNHGTLTNVTASAGWQASQGRYDLLYSSSHVNVPSPRVLALSDLTLSAWIYATSTGTGAFRAVVCKKAIPDSTGPTNFWLGLNNTNNTFAFYHYRPGASDAVFTTYQVPINTWTHIAATVRGVSLVLYANGMAVTSATMSFTPVPDTNNVTIGKYGDSIVEPQFFVGNIADVGIYNRALSPNEIRLLASRRGIAYEMAPRSWSAQQIAAYRARYYSQLVGGGVI